LVLNIKNIILKLELLLNQFEQSDYIIQILYIKSLTVTQLLYNSGLGIYSLGRFCIQVRIPPICQCFSFWIYLIINIYLLI
jgi:hypothetical protein